MSSDASVWEVSPSESSNESNAASSTSSATTSAPTMPWTERQEWAVRDALPNFTLQIRRSPEDGPQTYALWRRMISEVVELSGYQVDFVRQQVSSPPALMPYLTDFCFEAQGGIRGTVVGLEGVADYTTVQTSELRHVEMTVPLGYVCTARDNALYELGAPALSSSRVDLVEKDRSTLLRQLLLERQGLLNANKIEQTAGATADSISQMIQVGAGAALVMGGAATAMTMLSHHLTVNVFWV